MKLTVLNPKGRDPEQYFEDFAGPVSANAHPPVNYHAYAACLAGSFQRDVDKAIALGEPVLVLIRSDLKRCLSAVREVKAAGLSVAVTLKETGYHQFHKLLSNARHLEVFRTILGEADGVVSPTEALVPVFRALRPAKPFETCAFIPTPYPVDDPRWDFSVPVADRDGIFFGTRDLVAASRNHLQALIVAAPVVRETGCRVGLINGDGAKLARVLERLDFPMAQCEIHTRLSYPDYLRFMARHRVVFQLDQSMVPGQVAGDCTLTRIVALGGNGSCDKIVFPEFSETGQDRSRLLADLARLLADDDAYRNALAEAERRAAKTISYGVVAETLRAFYTGLRAAA